MTANAALWAMLELHKPVRVCEPNPPFAYACGECSGDGRLAHSPCGTIRAAASAGVEVEFFKGLHGVQLLTLRVDGERVNPSPR